MGFVSGYRCWSNWVVTVSQPTIFVQGKSRIFARKIQNFQKQIGILKIKIKIALCIAQYIIIIHSSLSNSRWPPYWQIKTLLKNKKDPYSQSNPLSTWFIFEVFLFLHILFTSSVVCLCINDILAEFYVFMQVVYLTNICFRWLVKPDIPIANLVMQFNRAFGALMFFKKLDNIKLKQGT